jgi:hypothetical protein
MAESAGSADRPGRRRPGRSRLGRTGVARSDPASARGRVQTRPRRMPRCAPRHPTEPSLVAMALGALARPRARGGEASRAEPRRHHRTRRPHPGPRPRRPPQRFLRPQRHREGRLRRPRSPPRRRRHRQRRPSHGRGHRSTRLQQSRWHRAWPRHPPRPSSRSHPPRSSSVGPGRPVFPSTPQRRPHPIRPCSDLPLRAVLQSTHRRRPRSQARPEHHAPLATGSTRRYLEGIRSLDPDRHTPSQPRSAPDPDVPAAPARSQCQGATSLSPPTPHDRRALRDARHLGILLPRADLPVAQCPTTRHQPSLPLHVNQPASQGPTTQRQPARLHQVDRPASRGPTLQLQGGCRTPQGRMTRCQPPARDRPPLVRRLTRLPLAAHQTRPTLQHPPTGRAPPTHLDQANPLRQAILRRLVTPQVRPVPLGWTTQWRRSQEDPSVARLRLAPPRQRLFPGRPESRASASPRRGHGPLRRLGVRRSNAPRVSRCTDRYPFLSRTSPRPSRECPERPGFSSWVRPRRRALPVARETALPAGARLRPPSNHLPSRGPARLAPWPGRRGQTVRRHRPTVHPSSPAPPVLHRAVRRHRSPGDSPPPIAR